MPMIGFDIYAVIVVMLDYLLIIFVLPSYYIFDEKHISCSWRSCCCKKKASPPAEIAEPEQF